MSKKSETGLNLAVIILTCNEAQHIQRCIGSVKELAKEVFVVDSGSSDETISIAESCGAKVYSNPWPGNQALQFNWALKHLPIDKEWILRLDADEYPMPKLVAELQDRLPGIPPNVSGITLPLERFFLNRRIRYGLGEIRLLRLFRNGKARYPNTLMDEHMEVTDGEIIDFNHGFADHSLISIGEWIDKHNQYATREAIQMLSQADATEDSSESCNHMTSNYARGKIKSKGIYQRLPLLMRGFGYFLYRYVFRLGFLDGKEGFLWHFLQGWWYRTLVDAKILELKRREKGGGV
jgi:glycosyltransferase involved in cell wall biosynthesis